MLGIRQLEVVDLLRRYPPRIMGPRGLRLLPSDVGIQNRHPKEELGEYDGNSWVTSIHHSAKLVEDIDCT